MFGWVRGTALGLGALALGGHMGGWAVISVENPPQYLEEGKGYRLEFMVRQHGVEPMTDLKPAVQVAWSGGDSLFPAEPTAIRGRYRADLGGFRGEARVTVLANWHEASLTMMPVPVVVRSAARPTLTPAEWGRRLFVAKGCGTCHLNGDVPESGARNRTLAIGPELTGRTLDAAYVRQRVTDPASLPRISPTARMPNLGLSASEADAIVALLTAPRQAASR